MQKIFRKSPVRLLKIAWLALSCLILIITLSFFDNQTNSDIEGFLIYSMLLLTFPSGLIVQCFIFVGWYIFINLLNSYEISFCVSYLYLIIVWLFLFTIGYIQWFYLLPLIYRYYKNPDDFRNDPK